MNFRGYELSREAAAAARRQEVMAAGNVVPIRARAAEQEERSAASSAEQFFSMLGIVDMASAADVVVNIDNALSVPAVAAAVNGIASAVAGLPLHIYKRGADNARERENSPLARLLHDAPNAYLSSFEWRRAMLSAKLTGGRGLSWIERLPSGRVVGIWPMDPAATTIRREGFRNVYEYREGTRLKTYQAEEVIDLPFMLKANGYSHRGPIGIGRDVIGMAIALTQYGARWFAGGGVPPFAIEGNFQTPTGMQRAADDLSAAVRKAASDKRQALVLPAGHKITPIGGDPEKAQMVEMQRFVVEQIARLYSIPPVFLQDLTHGTFSNTEQQDLHFVKHTLRQHVEQFEQELNLKLFGPLSNTRFIELNLDGLLRGDFKTRMEGWAAGVQTALVTPNEARAAENRPPLEGGDQLFIQGATVPLASAGKAPFQGNSGTQE